MFINIGNIVNNQVVFNNNCCY